MKNVFRYVSTAVSLLSMIGLGLSASAGEARPQGTVVAWGSDMWGESEVPAGLTNVVSVAVADSVSLALRSDGRVVAWGRNFEGQTNVPADLTNVISIAAQGWVSAAVLSDGTVRFWGAQRMMPPEPLTNVVAVAGGGHFLALQNTGKVVAWGTWNDDLQLNVPATLSDVVAIGAGWNFSMALRNDGTVAAWGGNENGQTDVPPGLSKVVAIAAGSSHCLALRSNGTVVAWGNNNQGQINVPAGLTNVVSIAAGNNHSVALRSDGTVVVWGGDVWDHQTSVPFDLENVFALAQGSGSVHCLALVDTSRPFAPVIAQQPAASTNVAGTTAIFSVRVVGTAPFACQWQHNGTNLPGETQSYLTISNVVPINSGNYTVAITNVGGCVTSKPAPLSVLTAPFIFTQPLSQIVLPNSEVTCSVDARGVSPISYQWAWNGTNIDGATNASFSIASVQESQAGDYSVTIANSYGSVTSDIARLTIKTRALERIPGRLVGWGANYSGETNIPAGLTNVVAVAACNHVLALRSDGTVVAWGWNDYHQTAVPPGLKNVVAVGAGAFGSMALRDNGTITAWGDLPQDATNILSSLTNVAAIAVGPAHYLALKNDGRVVGWGSNYGDETDVPKGLSNVVAIAVGGSHSLGLRRDGTVFAWGQNYAGQTNVPAGLTNVIAISAGGDYSLALRKDGTVAAWGDNYYGQSDVPDGLKNVIAISAGERQSLALRIDGSLVVWGDDDYGQQNVPANVTNVLSLGQALGVSSFAIIPSGVAPTITVQPRSMTNVVGTSASLSLVGSGTGPLTYQWFLNGIKLVGSTSTNLAIAKVQPGDGGNYTVVVENAFGAVTSAVARITVLIPPQIVTQPLSQTVHVGTPIQLHVSVTGTEPITYQWRKNGNSLSDGTQFVGARFNTLWIIDPQEADSGNYTILLSSLGGMAISKVATVTILAPATQPEVPQGNVAAWGYNYHGQTDVPAGLVDAVAVAAGGDCSLAVRRDGTVAAWGWNGYGLTNVPSGLTNVTSVAAGGRHNLALREDGTIAAWGWNYYGQTNVPSGLSNVVAVAAGDRHSMALRNDGTVVAWGWNNTGQTDVPAGLTNVTAISAGIYHNLALLNDGTVTAWGWNANGQTDVPAGLTNVTAIAAGGYHSLALRADGTVVAWGFDDDGQTDVPAGLTDVIAIAAGEYHSLALRSDRTVVAWGANDLGQTNVLGGLMNVLAIGQGAASSHGLAVVGILPTILTQPESVTNYVGTLAGFQVVGCGTATVGYQWQCNGTNIPGATAPNLVIPAVRAANEGYYTAVLSNMFGTITSKVASLTVAVRPAIARQPDSLTVTAGNEFSLSVAASGSAPLSYQWAWNGMAIMDATNSTYAVAHSQANDQGDYTVLVANPYGAVTSSVAKVTVGLPPVIEWFGGSDSVLAGTNAQFWVRAVGSAPLTYQWLLNGTVIPGATGSYYTISRVQPNHAGDYSVVVSNPYGHTISTVMTLTVAVMPSVTSQPQSQSAIAGKDATFSVGVAGSSPLTYQWLWNGTNIPGATNSSCTLTNVQGRNAGNYQVFIVNPYGKTYSSIAKLTILVPPSITVQPQDITVMEGKNAVLGVSCTGAPPISCQWYFNGAAMPGATNYSLGLTNLDITKAGPYSVVLTNIAGAVTSRLATVSVQHYRDYTFVNTNLIRIRDLKPALPYPSAIVVSNLNGTVTKATVQLSGLSHTWTPDVHVLLAGPRGQNVVLMQNAGGEEIVDENLTFDDSAAQMLSDWDTLVSGTYQPSRFGTNSVFPAPAPVAPYGTALSVFNGSDPNGEWSLFVRDIAYKDIGTITQGWRLSLHVLELVSTPATSAAPIEPSYAIHLSANGVVLSITSEPGSVIEVLRSTNLTEWTTFAILTNTTGKIETTVSSTSDSPQFYRVNQLR